MWHKYYKVHRIFLRLNMFVEELKKSEIKYLLILSLIAFGIFDPKILLFFFIVSYAIAIPVLLSDRSIYLLTKRFKNKKILKSFIVGLAKEKNEKIAKEYIKIFTESNLSSPHFLKKTDAKDLMIDLYKTVKLKQKKLEGSLPEILDDRIKGYEKEVRNKQAEIEALKKLLNSLEHDKKKTEEILKFAKIEKNLKDKNLENEKIVNNFIEND